MTLRVLNDQLAFSTSGWRKSSRKLYFAYTPRDQNEEIRREMERKCTWS